MAPEAAGSDFHFSSLFAQLLGFSFGFDPTFACRLAEGVCSPPRQDRTGLKEQVIRGLWLTQSGGRDGYGMHGEPAAAEATMTLHRSEACRVFPREVVPGSRDPGSAGHHRLLGREVWIVTCACTQDFWCLQQQP